MLNAQSSRDEFRQAVSPFLQGQGFAGGAELSVLHGGANNRVYRVSEDHQQAVLKHYFRNPNDPRDRFRSERSFYELIWGSGIRSVPEPLAWDQELRVGLFAFVPGRKLAPDEVGPGYVEQAADFVVEANRFGQTPAARTILPASEACFSLIDHLNCIEQRIARLRNIDPLSEVDGLACTFVREELEPSWQRVRKQIQQAEPSGRLKEQPLDPAARCLSPSDFGFHNALLTQDNQLRFFDFEYAGWDDPAKLICDFFCQPELPVSREWWNYFAARLTPSIGKEHHLAERALLLLPAYQIKWCCIMLNEFVRTDHARRDFSLGDAAPQRKESQLQKAREALVRIA